MIVRSRRGSDSFWSRIFRRKTTLDQQDTVLSDVDFAFALAKERSRCDRRSYDREFSLIELNIREFVPTVDVVANELGRELRKRLRITDEIGWRGNKLAILLPETDRLGAEFVTKDVGDVCAKLELKFDLDILVYPEDDTIAAESFEINPETAEAPKSVEASERKLDPARSVCLPQKTPVWKRLIDICLLYTSPSPRDRQKSRMPSSA